MSSIKKIDKNKNNKYAGKIECPECKSMNTVASSFSTNSLSIFIICVLGFSVSLWIPILGWICAPILLIMAFVALVSAILGIFTKQYTFMCNDCKSKYKIDKSEYNEIVKNKKLEK